MLCLVSLLGTKSWRFGTTGTRIVSGSWEKGLATQQPWRKAEAEKAESPLSLCGQLQFFLQMLIMSCLSFKTFNSSPFPVRGSLIGNLQPGSPGQPPAGSHKRRIRGEGWVSGPGRRNLTRYTLWPGI